MTGAVMHITNPERALWQAVLLQAVEEALHGPKNVTPYQRPLAWKEARAYVTRPSEDLAMVCAMAGVDMEAVIERMRIQISNALSPEELARGRRKQAA